MLRRVPAANPNRLASGTAAPAVVEDMCLPWPWLSLSRSARHLVRVHGPHGGLVPLVEEAHADKLPVAGGGVEPGARRALALPERGHLLEARVGAVRRRRLAIPTPPSLSHAQSFFFLRPPLTELEQLTFAGKIRAVPSMDFKSLAPEAPLPP